MSGILKRTNMCGELRLCDVGKEVVLNGWVAKQRSLGAIVFVDIRDKTGITQVTFNEHIPSELMERAKELHSEYVIGIRGVVEERTSRNDAILTGDIEVFASDLVIYSKADTPPIYIKDDDNVDEALRLKYRYLDLRKQKMQKNLSFRSEVMRITRDYFYKNGFTEVETPCLIKPTPEGARDYLVPSRIRRGSFYALPQSPQMYKQLLMVGGTDRYFQIARCFRDEDLRADRQPEFTQIDLEMSFADQDEVIEIQEGLIKRLMKELKNIEVKTPFPRLTWREAMERFGSDKPDTRFGSELANIADIVAESEFKPFTDAIEAGGRVMGICIPSGAAEFSRKKIDKLTDEAKHHGINGLIWIKIEDGQVKSSINKFFGEEELRAIADRCASVAEMKSTDAYTAGGNGRGSQDGDLVLICSGTRKIVWDTLGFLRKRTAELMGKLEDGIFNYLWVVDFPMFELNDDGEMTAMHHPFTQPKLDELNILEKTPLNVNADAYDIVLNGVELGGGSIRIHDRNLQHKMFDVLGLSNDECEEKFGFLLEAFKYGAPPHAGLAYGLDRFVMLILGESSIREVIAFPKNQNAEDPVSNAPGSAGSNQLKELGLKIVKDE